MEIPLRRKYTTHFVAKRNKNGRSDNHKAKRLHRELTASELALHERQPRKVMHLLANGKTRMERAL